MASQFFLLVFFLFNLASTHGDQIMLEDGYMVTTVMDGHKLNVNPRAVQLRSSDLVVLDSSKSVFYTLSFPISQDGVMVKRLSGSGDKGYIDGEPGLAQFNKPKSFTVDLGGNVYVADQLNHVVRKISSSGMTTTIVGNYSQTGRQNGPGKTATFSSDFEVDLKQEDCVIGSRSALGAVKFWVLGLVLSCLFGLATGFAIRPYAIPNEGVRPLHFCKTWKHCLIIPASLIPTCYFDVRNAIASSMLYVLSKRLLCLSLSHLSLMFRINIVGSKVLNKDSSSLMDADVNSHKVGKSPVYADQLKDLKDSNVQSQSSSSMKLGEGGRERCDASVDGCGRINDMIQANIMGFGELAEETTPVDVPLAGSLGLVKRR
ncbi:hypothetical protein OIU74_027573 [Salix koriyanagi]|uniref:NHL repeat-containing protein n=1 Tax=Salix koriyanagi TaxID=2511006 RepID=A0A9Q0ZZY0_9ROSI|nr:hypothetical protein OIU74_027573 [Salix koriyanagi]